MPFLNQQNPHIQIQYTEHSTHPIIEGAAILFANNQDKAALDILEEALEEHQPNEKALHIQLWGMLFSLYQIMDKHEVFEERALDFALRYERSPPTWIPITREPLSPALATGGQAYISFSGILDEHCEKQIKQFERIVSGNPIARIEFASSKGANAAGCALLLHALQTAKLAHCELILEHALAFSEILAGAITLGERKNEAIWLLLLELYQQLENRNAYEDFALKYAVLFEVSPPAWQERPVPQSLVPRVEPVIQEPGVYHKLTGQIYSTGSEGFRQLTEFSASLPEFAIDCAKLIRMDFVSTGALLNVLSKLHAQGKTIYIRAANCMIIALFKLLGIDKVAHIEEPLL